MARSPAPSTAHRHPIGSWASACVLDLFGGRRAEEAADRLIGVGVLAALPTAATGLSDWSDHLGSERRIGSVHAVANVTAVACDNVHRNAWDHGLEEWTEVLAEAEVADGKPVVVESGGRPILVVRRSGRLRAIANTCGHAGGPLSEGAFEEDCVVPVAREHLRRR